MNVFSKRKIFDGTQVLNTHSCMAIRNRGETVLKWTCSSQMAEGKGLGNGIWYDSAIECVMSVFKIMWGCGESCMLETRGTFDLSDKVTSSGLLFA